MLLNVRLNTKTILLCCLPIKVQAIPDNNNILQDWLGLKEERRFTVVLLLFSALLIALGFGVSQVITSATTLNPKSPSYRIMLSSNIQWRKHEMLRRWGRLAAELFSTHESSVKWAMSDYF